MGKNIKKRIIIIFVYIILFSLVGLLFYTLFKPQETCSDNIKNQNEEDVDCGGKCAKKCDKLVTVDLQVGDVGFVGSSTYSEYDFYGTVSNPNAAVGSEYFAYHVIFRDANGSMLGEKKGNSYVLPGEQKYIIENNISVSGTPTKVELVLSDSRWVEFYEYYKKPDMKIVNLAYNEITSGVGYYEVKGLLENESPFDFNVLKVKIIVKDFNGNIIALNSTAMGTVLSGEDRDFRAFWPGRFSGEVGNVETQIEVNVFKSESFAQKFFREQEFQQYSR